MEVFGADRVYLGSLVTLQSDLCTVNTIELFSAAPKWAPFCYVQHLVSPVKVIQFRPRQTPAGVIRNDHTSRPKSTDSSQHPINTTSDDVDAKIKFFNRLASAKKAAGNTFGFRDYTQTLWRWGPGEDDLSSRLLTHASLSSPGRGTSLQRGVA